MDWTFTSRFTTRAVPAEILEHFLSEWEVRIRQWFEVDVVEAARQFITSEGNYCAPIVEGIFEKDQGSKINILGYEGTQLFSGNRAVKTRVVIRLGAEEFQGELYITLIGISTQEALDKRFFAMWSILKENLFKVCTPLQWIPSAPSILIDNNPIKWILKVINRQVGIYVDTWEARLRFKPAEPTETESAEAETSVNIPEPETAVQETVEERIEPENAPLEADAQNPPEVEVQNTPETDMQKSSEVEVEKVAPPEPVASDTAKLLEQLEECKAENEELAEKNEQLASANRKLKKERKQLEQNIEDQKKRLKALKKRAESAEVRAKESASGDVKEFCDYFDKERERLENEGEEKDKLIEKLQQELNVANGKITSLKGRLSKQSSGNGVSGLLAAPESENEMYENEFGIALFSALHKAIEKTPTKNNSPQTRCIDVWQAIIDANPDLEEAFEKFCDDKDALKNAIVSGELDKKKYLLNPFNLTFGKHSNCHGKISFGADDRYIASTASTASETASGFSNSAKDIRNTFLFPT